jgi:hypothetical protein
LVVFGSAEAFAERAELGGMRSGEPDARQRMPRGE